MGQFDTLTGLPVELRNTLSSLVGERTQLDTLAGGVLSFVDSSGTPGSAIANSASGRSAIAASASACTITNSKVSANSVVICEFEDADATAIRLKVVPGSGSFVVTANAAATGNTKFRWYVVGAL